MKNLIALLLIIAPALSWAEKSIANAGCLDVSNIEKVDPDNSIHGSVTLPLGEGNPSEALKMSLPEVTGPAVRIRIEMESIAPSTGWVKKSEDLGYETITFFEWLGEDHFRTPGNGLLEFPIHIKIPGTYKFTWRNRVGFGTRGTEHNDSWLRVLEPAELFAVREGSTVRPKGICVDDCPNGAGADGWFKIYCARTLEWSDNTYTSDKDAHEIRLRFPVPGNYILQVSGRSRHHQIDHIQLELIQP